MVLPVVVAIILPTQRMLSHFAVKPLETSGEVVAQRRPQGPIIRPPLTPLCPRIDRFYRRREAPRAQGRVRPRFKARRRFNFFHAGQPLERAIQSARSSRAR